MTRAASAAAVARCGSAAVATLATAALAAGGVVRAVNAQVAPLVVGRVVRRRSADGAELVLVCHPQLGWLPRGLAGRLAIDGAIGCVASGCESASRVRGLGLHLDEYLREELDRLVHALVGGRVGVELELDAVADLFSGP